MCKKSAWCLETFLLTHGSRQLFFYKLGLLIRKDYTFLSSLLMISLHRWRFQGPNVTEGPLKATSRCLQADRAHPCLLCSFLLILLHTIFCESY